MPRKRLPFSMFAIPRPNLSTLTLAALAAGLEKIEADLTRGFRLNPDALPLATAELPLDQLAAGTLGRLFETGSVAAEEVSFLYSLDMGNTGREYQSKPIHNIAGLGIANGDRPMRPFAKPMVFEPRSFIRLQIEEISGPPGHTIHRPARLQNPWHEPHSGMRHYEQSVNGQELHDLRHPTRCRILRRERVRRQSSLRRQNSHRN